MKKPDTHFKKLALHYWPVLLLTAISVALIVGGFIVPPPGIIDPSVLTAAGEIFAFASLITFIVRAEDGADFSIRKGDMEVTVHNDDPESPKEDPDK